MNLNLITNQNRQATTSVVLYTLYSSRLDAEKTPIAMQQKMIRHTDIRTTMNIYGDVVTDEMSTAGLRVAELAFQINGAQAERESS
jgi:hypothetical protein